MLWSWKGGTFMAKPILDDELWEFIAPFLPPPAPRRFRYPGRKPLDDRQVLTGILFVLRTGVPWRGVRSRRARPAFAPSSHGAGSGATQHPPRQRVGNLPLGGGAHPELAAPVPPSARPMGTPRRHPRGVPHTGLYPYLP